MEEMAFKSLCHSVRLVQQEKMGSSQRAYVKKTSLDMFKSQRDARNLFQQFKSTKEMVGITPTTS